MESKSTDDIKTRYTNIRLNTEMYKALCYAKIETGDNIETLTQNAIKMYLIHLGMLKESGEVNKPDPIVLKQEDNNTEV